MNTRKYPRTLAEAFGPYASGPICEPEPRGGYGAAWWACVVLAGVAAVVLGVAT